MARKFIERVKKFLHFLQHDLWRIDLVHDSKIHAFGVEALRVIHLVLKGVKEDNCRLHAAALTFSTLMALAPFLVILFAIANAIGFTLAEQKILEAIEQLPPQLQEFITQILDAVGGISPAALGGVSGVLFLYIIFKLLSGIEESFNQIWGVQSSRAIADKIRNYLSVLVIAPILMLIANAVSGALTAYSSRIEWLGPIVKMLLQIAPVLILSFGFVAVFVFLPNTKVAFRAAVTGALTSATIVIVLQIFIISFGKAMFSSDKYAVYGSFASIPIFLFWLNLNWTILLFGAELAFAIQNRDTYAEEQAAVRASMVSKLWVAYSLMQEAVRVFQGSESVFRTGAYARANNIPIRLMNEVVEVLSRANLIGAVVAEGQDAYALLQAPENVSAKKIFDLMITDGSSPKDLGLAEDLVTDEVLNAADLGLDGTLDPITLRRFMSEDGSA
jgi:membrane protein